MNVNSKAGAMPSREALINSAFPAGQGGGECAQQLTGRPGWLALDRQAQLDCVTPLAPLPFHSHQATENEAFGNRIFESSFPLAERRRKKNTSPAPDASGDNPLFPRYVLACCLSPAFFWLVPETVLLSSLVTATNSASLLHKIL
jgi:hypothetical protein